MNRAEFRRQLTALVERHQYTKATRLAQKTWRALRDGEIASAEPKFLTTPILRRWYAVTSELERYVVPTVLNKYVQDETIPVTYREIMSGYLAVVLAFAMLLLPATEDKQED